MLVLRTFILRSWTSSLYVQHMYSFYGRADSSLCFLQLIAAAAQSAGHLHHHHISVWYVQLFPCLPVNRLNRPDRQTHHNPIRRHLDAVFFSAACNSLKTLHKCMVQLLDFTFPFHTSTDLSPLCSFLVLPYACCGKSVASELCRSHFVFLTTINSQTLVQIMLEMNLLYVLPSVTQSCK